MSIKEFQEKHKDFCNKYNKNLDLYYRCCEYIEQEGRTPAELDKYTKILNLYIKTMGELLIEYKELNGKDLDNRQTLGGFLLYEVA